MYLLSFVKDRVNNKTKIQRTLINSSCISRNSSFLLLSATASSDGRVVTPTVSTTSSGSEDNVAWTASSGFTLPDTLKALQQVRKWKYKFYYSNKLSHRPSAKTQKDIKNIRIIKNEVTWKESTKKMVLNGSETSLPNHAAVQRNTKFVGPI